jgi:Lysozyme like domain
MEGGSALYVHRSRYRRTRLRHHGRLTPAQAGTALAAGLALAWYAHATTAPHGTAATTTAAAAAAPAAAGNGELGCQQLEALWEQAGGPASAAFLAAEVARAESGGRPGAANYNANGTVDRGLWQINSIWGAESTYNALANAKAAVSISRDGTNWSPWVTYQRGLEAGQCSQ